jgi:hypothetical protein
MTPAQRAAAEAEAKAQTEADKKWSFSLETWYRRSLGTGPKAAEAEAHLAQVNDPRAVPRIRKDFLKKRNPEEPRRYQVAARLLAQIDGSEAGDVLVNLAFFGPTEAVQNEAAELLPTCTPSNVVGPLIDLVHAPSRYRRISDFELRVEGEYGIDQTRYEPHVGTNSEATGAEIEAAHQASIRDAKSRLETRIAEIKRNNLKILRMNARIRPILRRLTGIDLRDDREAWKVWWADAQGYAYSPPPPQTTIRSESVSVTPYHPCFGAGTLVRTQTGLAPIEDLAVGDQVLVQDTATGVLSFQPIVATTHCPPAPTLRVILKDDVLIATGIHRFWRPGRGWALARDLKPGESVRILGGLAQVTAVEPAPMQPVFSLMVAAGRSFFVGHTGALARDDSPPEPASPPFDAVPTPEISAPHTN